MKRLHRSVHRWMWLILLPVLVVFCLFALSQRQKSAVFENPVLPEKAKVSPINMSRGEAVQ
ncbi:MAG: hypothetical protein KTR17_10305 [Cellvibrionaceae bacterium]|nr:hypothetical protein [Cellvibrionaceae bacterium]